MTHSPRHGPLSLRQFLRQRAAEVNQVLVQRTVLIWAQGGGEGEGHELGDGVGG